MLKYLRMQSKRTKALWWALIVVTVVTFIGGFVFIFGAGLDPGQQARTVGALGVVNGQQISPQLYLEALNLQRENYRQQFKADPQGRDEQLIEVQAWRSLVDNAILRSQAAKHGIRAYDPEVVFAMKNNPPAALGTIDFFRTNGQFDPQKYAQALRDPNVNWSYYEELVRRDMPVRKLQTRFAASIKVSEPEVRMAFQDRFEKLDLKWLRIPAVAGGEAPQPPDSVLQRVYDRRRGELFGPGGTQLESIEVPKPVSTSDLQSVREQALAIVSRARAGQSLAELARSYSVGPYAEQGGAIDRIISRAELGPALLPVLSQMRPGELTDPMPEGALFYIFRLDSLLGPEGAPSYRISQILLRARVDDAQLKELTDRLNAVRARARKVGLGTAAAEKGLPTQRTPFYDWTNGPPQLFAMPKAAEWGLTAPVKAVSGIFENDDVLVLVQVVARRVAGPRPLDEVRERVRALAEIEARADMARPGAERVARMMSEGRTLEEAAAAVGLSVEQAQGMTRRTPDPRIGQSPEVVGAAFGMAEGGVAGPVRGRDGWYFLAVVGRTPPDEANYTALRDQIASQLLQAKQSAIFGSWLGELRAAAKVQDLRPELQAVQ